MTVKNDDATVPEAGGTGPRTVTRLLRSWREGDNEALDRLMPQIYDELEKIALGYIRHERVDHTLPAAALVHEAFLRLVGQNRVVWRNRSHFFAIAARIMKRILVDHGRRQSLVKHGGATVRLRFDELETPPLERAADLTALEDALSALEARDPELSEIVTLRYFGGHSAREIAELLNTSTATVTRKWRLARAWLHRFLLAQENGATESAN